MQLVTPLIDSDPAPQAVPMGSITPRLWTRPLRTLTPRTSYGYAVIHFAATVLGRPLDPWQQWLVIHLGELLDDGRPRFRQVLVIVARQNGKTHLCTILALFWLYVERQPLVFGTSNKLDYAKDSWEAALTIALDTPALAARTRKPRVGNGQQDLPTADRCHYRIGASNDDGGRSKSIDRAIGDELRQQRDWSAYYALVPAMSARPKAQLVYITNMGDVRSVVLNSLRADALEGVDERLGLFEWSAPAGTHPTDVAGQAMANPQLGRGEGRMDYESLAGQAARVSRPGADPVALAGFLTEVLCIGVPTSDPAVSPARWAAAAEPAPLPVSLVRPVACLDVAPDGRHASLAVACLAADGRVRVEIVHAWEGPDALDQARRTLRPMLDVIKPASFGWFPSGPAAAIDADLRDRTKSAGRSAWPPRGMRVEEIKTDAYAVCMGFAEQVDAGRVVHSAQALLDAQVSHAEKLWAGARWVFRRAGESHVDAVYAAAGAVHLARTGRTRRPATRRVRTPGQK